MKSSEECVGKPFDHVVKEGMDAHKRGDAITTNPNPESSDTHGRWKQGWELSAAAEEDGK